MIAAYVLLAAGAALALLCLWAAWCDRHPHTGTRAAPRWQAARGLAARLSPMVLAGLAWDLGTISWGRRRRLRAVPPPPSNVRVIPAPSAALPPAQDDPGRIYTDWVTDDSGIMRALRGLPV